MNIFGNARRGPFCYPTIAILGVESKLINLKSSESWHCGVSEVGKE